MSDVLRRVVAAGFALGLGACTKVGPSERIPSPAPPPPAATPPTCRDWSNFDFANLPPVPPSEYVHVLDAVWTRVAEKHYDVKLGCVDWSLLRQDYATRLAGAKDRSDAYRMINEMLGELHQSHLRLFLPDGDAEAVGPAEPAVGVRWIEDEVVVVQSDEPNVPTGAMLEAIDGASIADVIARARTRSGTTESSAFAAAVSRLTEAKLSCFRIGEPRRIEFTTLAGERRTETVECRANEGDPMSLGHLNHVPTRVEHRSIEGTGVGYLAFNVWLLPMVPRIESALKELRTQGMKGLVLDLRGNPGGVGPMVMPVARLFLDQRTNLGKFQLREFTQEFNVEPGRDPFLGPVAILIDERTASTSEIFVVAMRDLERVTVFGGRASEGAALPSVIEKLADNAILQYVVGNFTSPKGTVVEGTGVIPDRVVVERKADFAQGRDPVLEAAVEWLKSVGYTLGP